MFNCDASTSRKWSWFPRKRKQVTKNVNLYIKPAKTLDNLVFLSFVRFICWHNQWYLSESFMGADNQNRLENDRNRIALSHIILCHNSRYCRKQKAIWRRTDVIYHEILLTLLYNWKHFSTTIVDINMTSNMMVTDVACLLETFLGISFLYSYICMQKFYWYNYIVR